MLTTSQNMRKLLGVHFTPPGLAHALSRRILDACFETGLSNKGKLRVLDPACGDGELLVAFAQAARETGLDKVEIFGADTNKEMIKRAAARFSAKNVSFASMDFLEYVENQHFPSLFGSVALQTPTIPKADVIIANPPYVRTQHLGAEKAQELAKIYGLSGRVDLYQVFMVAMTYQLAPGGILGVILSNRFLTTKDAASLRSYLEREYDILEIIDLGDTKLFEAAVLPAVFLGRKKDGSKHNFDSKFVRIYEYRETDGSSSDEMDASSIYEVLDNPTEGIYAIGPQLYNVACGHLSLPVDSKEPWAMLTRDEMKWVNQIESNSAGVLKDIADVRVGIKTTADNVFIRSDWNELPHDSRPEGELLYPVVFPDDVSRWRLSNGEVKKQVLYTHKAVDGERVAIDLGDYPKAARYLEAHKEQLEGRKYVLKARRNWYEIWVPQQPSLWPMPKVVFPDISEEPRFAYSADNVIVNGNCYWITLKPGVDEDVLFFIMALANSATISKYHELRFQNRLYSGRKRYLSQYVERYPLPDYRAPEVARVVELAKSLVYSEQIEATVGYEYEINQIIAEMLGDPDIM